MESFSTLMHVSPELSFFKGPTAKSRVDALDRLFRRVKNSTLVSIVVIKKA